jgi:hypothetical protein
MGLVDVRCVLRVARKREGSSASVVRKTGKMSAKKSADGRVEPDKKCPGGGQRGWSQREKGSIMKRKLRSKSWIFI